MSRQTSGIAVLFALARYQTKSHPARYSPGTADRRTLEKLWNVRTSTNVADPYSRIGADSVRLCLRRVGHHHQTAALLSGCRHGCTAAQRNDESVDCQSAVDEEAFCANRRNAHEFDPHGLDSQYFDVTHSRGSHFKNSQRGKP
jgi:hypothetical protein